MIKRLLTGICILLVVAGFTVLRIVHLSFFDAFVFILMIIAGFEFISAKNKSGKMLFERLVIFYPVPVTLGYVFCDSLFAAIMVELLSILVIFVVSVCIELIVYGINRKRGGAVVDDNNLLCMTKNTMSVIIYPLSIISFMFMLNHAGYNLGYVLIITMFAVSMVTDTFAYIFGMLFGKNKTKLAPEISPKKSLVGAIAGMVGGLIVGMACWLMFYHFELLNCGLTTSLSTTNSVILFSLVGLLGSLATQVGDLLASSVKRQAQIKDFSHILPGHGGIMDRIDGEIFCAAVVAVMFFVFLI